MSNVSCIRRASLYLAALSVCLICVMAPTSECSADDRVHAFMVGELWTGTADPISDAVMLVSDGRIQAVGERNAIEIPASAVVHDLSDSVIVPGLVIAETSLGIATDDERTLTPEVRAIDGFDPFADYSRYVAAGITTVQISPGQQRLMPGQGAVVKLAGDDVSRRILNSQESLRIVLSSESASPPRIYEPPVGAVSVDNPLEPTRPQISSGLASRMAGLRAILTAARTGAEDDTGTFDFDAFRKNVARGRIRIKAKTSAEIRAAFQLFAELQRGVDKRLSLVLTDPAELDSVIEDLDKLKSVAFVLNAGIRPGQLANPSLPGEDQRPPKQAWDYAAAMFAAGIGDTVALRPASDSDLDDVMFLAGLFTRGGNSAVNVIQMLTANPARILGVDSKVGSLAAKRDADFVVLSGKPFRSGTLVESTWVNGQRVYHREAVERATLVEADTIYTAGGNTVSAGQILVAGQKIQAVGPNVSIPGDVVIRRFPGAVIVPGFVDLGTGLGFGGSVSKVTLSTKLGDRLASDDRTIAYARQGGVTTAVFATSASPSPLLAFKLSDVPRLMKEPVGIRFSMPSNLTSGVPSLQKTLKAAKAYADSWTKYEKDLAAYKVKLKEYEAALAKYEADKKKAAAAAAKAEAAKKAEAEKTGASAGGDSGDKKDSPKPDGEKPEEQTAAAAKTGDSAKAATASSTTSANDTKTKTEATDPKAPVKPTEPKKPKVSASSEPYRALMAGKIPAVVNATSVNAIKAAVKLFREEFQLNMILIGADEAHRVADLLAQQQVSVSVGPTLVRRVENAVVNLPQVLANEQVPFAFQSNATTGVRQLPLAVQYAVFRGLSPADALHGLTESAAGLLSLDSSIGSLVPGKDADLVVMSGPPFEPSSEVLAVMIDGEWVYDRGAKP